MKKQILFGILAAAIATPAMADGFVVTEPVNTYEKLTIDTVRVVNDAYVAPKCARATGRWKKLFNSFAKVSRVRIYRSDKRKLA